MKSSVFLFAAFATASTHYTRKDDEPVTTYRTVIANIAQDVQAYCQQVTTFGGSPDKAALLDAISQLEDSISESITTLQSQPSLDEEDTMVVSIELLNLDDFIKEAITNTTNQKSIFVESCLGPTILQLLQTEQTSFGSFISALSTKVDPSFHDIIDNVHDDFVNAFQTGIDAFADHMSLPASCRYDIEHNEFDFIHSHHEQQHNNKQHYLNNHKQHEHFITNIN